MKIRKDMVQMGTKIGVVIGLIAFLAFGIMPAFFFGGFGALTIMTNLFGSVVTSSILVKIGVVMGILLGEACVAFLSMVIGGLFGAGVGYLTEALLRNKETVKVVA